MSKAGSRYIAVGIRVRCRSPFFLFFGEPCIFPRNSFESYLLYSLLEYFFSAFAPFPIAFAPLVLFEGMLSIKCIATLEFYGMDSPGKNRLGMHTQAPEKF